MPTFEKRRDCRAGRLAHSNPVGYVRRAQENGMIEQRINDVAWTDEAYRCVGARDAKLVVIFACEAVQS